MNPVEKNRIDSDNKTKSTSRLTKFHSACTGYIKRILERFKRQIVSLFLRIKDFDIWSETKSEIRGFRRQLHILNKKKTCLSNILTNSKDAEKLLSDFDTFQKEEFKTRTSRLDELSDYLDTCEKVIVEDYEDFENNTIDRAAAQKRKKEEIWTDHVERFRDIINELERISSEKLKLEKKIIDEKHSRKDDFTTELKTWGELNEKERICKDNAQQYYKEKLGPPSRKLWDWALVGNGKFIMYAIFDNKEQQYRDAILSLLSIERANIEKLKKGDPTALNLIAKKIDMDIDRDMEEFALSPKDLPEELLRLKIENIKEDIRHLNKHINDIEKKAKKQFKVDAIPDIKI